MMTKPDLETYRQVLQSLRQRLTGDVSHLANEALRATGGEASGSLSNAPLHMADLGTDNFEQEFTLTLMQNQEQALTEIADALERINQGTFGRCEECHGAIPKARLQALPYTRHCVACARKLQQSS
jgi:DnaK suppressor protein